MSSSAASPLAQTRVAIVSRCARTLFLFRRPLIHSLERSGARVVALGAAGDGFEVRLRAEGITFHHVPIGFRSVNPGSDVALLIRLVRLFRDGRPDVVHAFTIKPAIFGTLAAAWAGVPVRIVTITGLGHAFTTAGSFVRYVSERLYQFALRRASLVFFQNEEDRALFERRGLVDPAVARGIPGSGIDLDQYQASALPSSNGTAPCFLMIARLLAEKGVHEFLAAAARVKADLPEVRFLLAGGVDARNPSSLTATEASALRASSSVEWLGDVPDVRPFIADADVVVLPSYREGLPRVLLEGGAMGRALIATDVPGCRDVVQHGESGLLVPPRDTEALVGAIRRLAGNPATIAHLGRRARHVVEQRFDQRLVIETTLRAYLEELSRSSRPA